MKEVGLKHDNKSVDRVLGVLLWTGKKEQEFINFLKGNSKCLNGYSENPKKNRH